MKPLTLVPRFTVGQAHAVALSPDAKLLAVASDRELGLWDMTAGKRLRKLKALPDQGSPSFSPNGALLAVKNPLGDLALVDVQGGGVVARVRQKTRDEGPTSVFLDDAILIDGSWSGKLTLRNSATLAVLHEEQLDGMIVAVAAKKDSVLAWVAARGALDRSTLLSRRVRAQAVSSSSKPLNFPGVSRVRIAKDGRKALLSLSHQPALELYALAPAPKRLARVATARVGAKKQPPDQLTHPGWAAFSETGKLIAVGDGKLLQLLDGASLSIHASLPWPGACGGKFSKDGKTLVVASWKNGAVMEIQ